MTRGRQLAVNSIGKPDFTDDELERLGMMRVQVENFAWDDDRPAHAPVSAAPARRRKR